MLPGSFQRLKNLTAEGAENAKVFFSQIIADLTANYRRIFPATIAINAMNSLCGL